MLDLQNPITDFIKLIRLSLIMIRPSRIPRSEKLEVCTQKNVNFATLNRLPRSVQK